MGFVHLRPEKARKQYLGWCKTRRVLASEGLKNRRCSGIGSDTIEICSFRLNVNCSCTLECDIGNKSKYSMRLHCWAATSACCSWQLLPGEKSRKHLVYKRRIKVCISSAGRISLPLSLPFFRDREKELFFSGVGTRNSCFLRIVVRVSFWTIATW